MSLVDFSKKDASVRPLVITGKEPVETVVSHPLTEEGIADLVAETGVDDVSTLTIDCSNVPKGTWGRTKVEAWYADNGLPVSANAEKNELVAAAKKLCKDQEQS